MNKINTSNWTAGQFIAGREALVFECAKLEKDCLAIMPQSAIPARPVLKNSSAVEIMNHFDAMQDHVAKMMEVLNLTGDLAALIKAKASSAQTPAAHAAQPGATAAIGAEAKKPKFDPDAAILAARGVKSLDELNALGSAVTTVAD